MPVYVLHIEPPYLHARHYIGFTTRKVGERVADHFAGRGSPLVKAALDAGHVVTIAHSWRCGTRGFERSLKNRKDTPNWCPICGAKSRPRPTFAAFKRRELSHVEGQGRLGSSWGTEESTGSTPGTEENVSG